MNLDYEWGYDVCWDIAKALPFRNGKMRGIYTEHCLEHVSFEVCDFALREFRRVLAPDGVLRIVVPDGELYMRRYIEGLPIPFGKGDASPMVSVNRIFYDHGHRFIYDFETLSNMLHAAGFKTVERKSYNHGTQGLLIDSEHRAVESLYLEAR